MAEHNPFTMEPTEVTVRSTSPEGVVTERRALRIPLRDEFPIEEVTEQ